MKVLYIAHNHGSLVSGGSIISERNLYLLQEYFGENNVINASECGLVCRNRDLHFEGKVQKLIDSWNIDIVFLDNSMIGYFCRSFYEKNRVICFFHNVESVYAHKNPEMHISIRKALVRSLIRAKESNNAKYSLLCLAINRRDAEQIKRLYGRMPDYILGSSMKDACADHDFLQDCTVKDKTPADGYLLFVGVDFFGNTDGLLPFVKNCMPHIHCRLVVVGTGMDRYSNTFDDSCKTQFYGYTDDISALYYGARAVVLPIVSGSGMKTKTCEALMYGKKIFGTKEAFEGFEHLNQTDCVLCNNDDDFISRINAFIDENLECYSELNRQSYLQYYSNEAVKNDFFSFLDRNI